MLETSKNKLHLDWKTESPPVLQRVADDFSITMQMFFFHLQNFVFLSR